ncbi:MAG: flavohemoprotein [Bdellovibrionaceae bacterium]|nr:flavohemoprotein [Pseudobdellovibrionaceae bacterium]
MALDIKLIRSSFEKARPIGPKVVAKFYEILFSDYPQAKPLFADVNLVKQQKALLNAIVYVVDHLDNEEALHKFLFDMGKRHVEYGAHEEHYDWVGASLLKAFAFFFEEAWTDHLQNQWATAYGVMKEIMIEGQRSVQAAPKDLRLRATEICNSLLLEVLEDELDPRIVEAVRTKVRDCIMLCLEEESSRLLKKAV